MKAKVLILTLVSLLAGCSAPEMHGIYCVPDEEHRCQRWDSSLDVPWQDDDFLAGFIKDRWIAGSVQGDAFQFHDAVSSSDVSSRIEGRLAGHFSLSDEHLIIALEVIADETVYVTYAWRDQLVETGRTGFSDFMTWHDFNGTHALAAFYEGDFARIGVFKLDSLETPEVVLEVARTGFGEPYLVARFHEDGLVVVADDGTTTPWGEGTVALYRNDGTLSIIHDNAIDVLTSGSELWFLEPYNMSWAPGSTANAARVKAPVPGYQASSAATSDCGVIIEWRMQDQATLLSFAKEGDVLHWFSIPEELALETWAAGPDGKVAIVTGTGTDAPRFRVLEPEEPPCPA